MNKKIVIPTILVVLLIIIVISTCMGGGSKIEIICDRVDAPAIKNDSLELKVYVENSGSMDAYMCPGSNLKDAVFDYISDLKKHTYSCSLYYINSQIIPYKGNLDSYIKDLTPSSFALAGGNRANTDLRAIISAILRHHKQNTISVFVSDCILDISGNTADFFGNCQISIKNAFNDALSRDKNLGVEIIQLESKFDGYWYCGNNSEKLSSVKRPYYIWIIGSNNNLAMLNKNVKVDDIIGGIKNYCAFSPSQKIPFDFDKKKYMPGHTRTIKPELLVNLDRSLQSELQIENKSNYKFTNPTQISILSIQKINAGSPYSHVIELGITNPETLKSETITFSYPNIPDWVVRSNDTTGTEIKKNIDKTTGILYLVKGVSEAYKSYTDFGSISFNLKNK